MQRSIWCGCVSNFSLHQGLDGSGSLRLNPAIHGEENLELLRTGTEGVKSVSTSKREWTVYSKPLVNYEWICSPTENMIAMVDRKKRIRRSIKTPFDWVEAVCPDGSRKFFLCIEARVTNQRQCTEIAVFTLEVFKVDREVCRQNSFFFLLTLTCQNKVTLTAHQSKTEFLVQHFENVEEEKEAMEVTVDEKRSE